MAIRYPVLILTFLLATACPHDFSRNRSDAGVGDGTADTADRGSEDLSSEPDLAPDSVPYPDLGCALPCVETLPVYSLREPVDVAWGAGKVFLVDAHTHQVQDIVGNTLTTIAGDGTLGFLDGAAVNAQFATPTGVAVDPAGTILVADRYNHRIRVISGKTVTTLAGSSPGFQDGAIKNALFNMPTGVAVDAAGTIYVADSNNHRVRMIKKDEVSTLAGSGIAGPDNGSAKSAQFYSPRDVAVDDKGSVYVADMSNNQIRVITGGQVSTLAGIGLRGYKNGAVDQAMFRDPMGVAVDSVGRVYVADSGNHSIRLIWQNKVSTLAGTGNPGFKDGPGVAAQFYEPMGVDVDGNNNIYVADSTNYRIRFIRH